MIPYFENRAAHRVAVQAHAAHEKKLSCSALTMLQIQANGDVTTCSSMPSIGSIRNGRFAKSGADVHGGGSQVAACLAKKVDRGPSALGMVAADSARLDDGHGRR